MRPRVEALRVFAKGPMAEFERSFGPALAEELRGRGHPAQDVDFIAGCLAAIAFEPDGKMTDASCWRGDGAPMGVGGGRAREGVVFWPAPLYARLAGRTAPPQEVARSAAVASFSA